MPLAKLPAEEHVEKAAVQQPSSGPEGHLCPPHTTERKLVTRIDLHLMPFIIALYLLSFLDRVNIANAKSFQLAEDLHLGGVEYNTCLTIFFVPYILAEIPSNMLLKRLSPRLTAGPTLPTCMVGFGIASICQGLVQNFAGLLATRFFLGLFEGGMFPGCFYLLGMWYKRHEAQKRYSLFFSSTSLAGAFGGLLATGIGQMHGAGGYSGWRWIFIIEGLVTVVVAGLFFIRFPSFPEQATWLREDERSFVKGRLVADQGQSGIERNVTFRDAAAVMKDFRVWLGGFMYFGLIVPAYGYAYFAPTIISGYGYSPLQTQLHSVPPWAASFVFSLLIAALSDRTRHRALFAIGPLALSIAGFAILLAVHTNTRVQYAALFLVVMGTFGAMPIIVCWFNMNLGGHRRRSVGIAWQIGFGNIGGIISTYIFLSTDAPLYTKGYVIAIAFTCLSAACCVAYLITIVLENRRRAATAGTVGNMSEAEKAQLGDLCPEFRYMY